MSSAFDSRPPTYSGDAIVALADRYGFTEGSRAELKKRLNEEAWIWHRNTRMTTPIAAPSQIRKELQDVHKQMCRLQSALSNLSPSARQAIQRAESNAERPAILEELRDQVKYPFVGYPSPDGSFGNVLLSLDDLRELLDGFGSLVSDTAEGLSSRPAGRRRDHATRIWVKNIAEIWTELLGRPFTRDVTDAGEPITEAARFCVDTFKALAPRAPQSRILTVMKEHIAGQR
jgi:hypothetical protein